MVIGNKIQMILLFVKRIVFGIIYGKELHKNLIDKENEKLYVFTYLFTRFIKRGVLWLQT